MKRGRNNNCFFFLCMCFATFVCLGSSVQAQMQQWKEFRLEGDLMTIKLSKTLSPTALDSFIQRYRLQDLGLRSLLLKRADDSLLKAGWSSVANADAPYYLFTKKLGQSTDLRKPAEGIVFSEVPTPENWRKLGGNRIVYGINRFKTDGLQIRGDTVFFLLKGFQKASEVRLAGSFTNWQQGAFH